MLRDTSFYIKLLLLTLLFIGNSNSIELSIIPLKKPILDKATKQSKLDQGEQADVVISSLPLMVFPETLRKNVVSESYKSLKKDGIYIQFQYSLQSKKLLEATYKKVSLSFTIKNLPPAFVYTCYKT